MQSVSGRMVPVVDWGGDIHPSMEVKSNNIVIRLFEIQQYDVA